MSIFLLRLVTACVLIGLGAIDSSYDLSRGKITFLWIFLIAVGGVQLVHLALDEALKAIPERTVDKPKSYFETNRNIVQWLIAASGIMVGLVTRSGITDLTKLGVYLLAASILLGILYVSVLVGSVKKDNSETVTLEVGPLYVAVVLLNLTWSSFMAGVIAIAISLGTS